MSARRGFTLLELLVAVFIITLLMMLLLPAVESAREASRRTSCANNMHQYGLALAAFEAKQQKFPAGVTLSITGPLIEDSKWRVHHYIAYLLPHLGQGPLADQYRFDLMFCAPENLTVIEQQLPFAICPSAPSRKQRAECNFRPSLVFTQSIREHAVAGPVLQFLDDRYSASFRGGLTDYVVVTAGEPSLAEEFGYGTTEGRFVALEGLFPFPQVNEQDLLDQFLPLFSSSDTIEISRGLRVAQITDGLSSTCALVEAAGRPQHWIDGKRVEIDEPIDRSWADPRSVQVVNRGGAQRRLIQGDNREGPYSFHPHAVNLLYADGHVDAVSIQVEPRVLLAWLTPDRNDPFKSPAVPPK